MLQSLVRCGEREERSETKQGCWRVRRSTHALAPVTSMMGRGDDVDADADVEVEFAVVIIGGWIGTGRNVARGRWQVLVGSCV